ncbi:MAG: DUF1614 domain-containing protein [Candidatus Bathyarchaeia archaeon]
MERRTLYIPFQRVFFMLFVVILTIALSFLFLGLIGKAFGSVGFGILEVSLLLIATLLGSYINIPLKKIRTIRPVVEQEYVSAFGIVYTVPRIRYGIATTLLAINVGGALIPTLISLYLLLRMPSVLVYAMIGVAFVTVITHLIARPVHGVGIATPALLPPLAAALSSYLLPSVAPYVVAYVSGVLGTLIGADLLNLNVVSKLGAPVVSIGGAGTFDGIFLSGIIAVLLA